MLFDVTGKGMNMSIVLKQSIFVVVGSSSLHNLIFAQPFVTISNPWRVGFVDQLHYNLLIAFIRMN